jgi:DNA-binding MarR family transcriptional regulator
MPTQQKAAPRARTAKRKPHADQGQLAAEIRILSSIVFKLAAREMEQRVEAALPGTSLLQYGVMRLLLREPMTLSELSGKMMLSPSTLVPAVDRLEREGLVVRGKDPNDRRRTPLIVTPAAQTALDAIPPTHPDDRIVHAVSEMGTQRVAQLRDLLHELLTRMSPDRDLLDNILSNHPDIHCKR